jgi:hypothetical protein
MVLDMASNFFVSCVIFFHSFIHFTHCFPIDLSAVSENKLSIFMFSTLNLRMLTSLLLQNCYVQKRTHTHGSLRTDLTFLWVNAIFRRPLNENLLTYRYEILHI